MAARTLRPRHQEEIRAKIQTSQLLNRIQNHIDGTIELSPTQLDAAKFLVNKSLSNPAIITENNTNITGDLDLNLNVKFK